jgi:hypothetical protein
VAALVVPTVPLHPSEPVPPPAVQEVAPVVDHASVVVCPDCTVSGEAVKATMLAAAGALVTLTLTELGTLLPPIPVQVSEYT